jgi:large subunit ribosomal protein L15
MQFNQLKPKHKLKKKKRVGRGGKRGAYSGRGLKGQKSRAGRKLVPVIRELIKKHPKLRGYKFKSKIREQKSKIAVLNLNVLENKFKMGETVSPKSLFEKGLISRTRGQMPKVKILAKGKLTKSLIIENCQFSEAAKKAIEKARGKIG